MMAILHVRNVPDELYNRLKEQARAKKRSLSAEVITLLDRGLAETELSQAEILKGIRRRRFFRPDQVGAPDSTTLLHEDRAR
jgi:plasmid stability protein